MEYPGNRFNEMEIVESALFLLTAVYSPGDIVHGQIIAFKYNALFLDNDILNSEYLQICSEIIYCSGNR